MMNATGIAGLAVGLAWCTLAASAEENYWAKIHNLLEKANTREAAEAARKYVQSLNSDQLLIAGRQCGRELQDAIDSGQPGAGDGAIAFGFFSESYPRATNDLRDIGPILQEIRDKTQPAIWRSELIGILLGRRWDAKLNNHQRNQVFECLEEVLNDKTDGVRGKIPLRLAHLLLGMFKDYRGALRSNTQDKQAEKELEAFAEQVGKYFENNRKLLSDVATPSTLREKLLAGMMVCYKESLPGSGSAKDIVIQAVTNYRDYPESLWPQLAAYAVDDLHMANVDTILDQMISQAVDTTIGGKIQVQKSMGRKK